MHEVYQRTQGMGPRWRHQRPSLSCPKYLLNTKTKIVDLQMVKTRQRSKPKFQPGHRQTIQRARQKSKHQVQPLKKTTLGTLEKIYRKSQNWVTCYKPASFPFSPGANNVNSGQLLIGSFWCPADQSDVMLLAAGYKKGLLQDLCLPCALCSQSAWVCVAFLQHDQWLCCGPSRFSHTLYFSRDAKGSLAAVTSVSFQERLLWRFCSSSCVQSLVRPSYVVLISLSPPPPHFEHLLCFAEVEKLGIIHISHFYTDSFNFFFHLL